MAFGTTEPLFCVQVEMVVKMKGWDNRRLVGAHQLSGKLEEGVGPMVMISQQEGDKWRVIEMQIFSLNLEKARREGAYLLQFTPLDTARQIQEGEVFCRVVNELQDEGEERSDMDISENHNTGAV